MSRWLSLFTLLFVTLSFGHPATADNAATAQQLFTELSTATPVKVLRGQRVVIAGPKATDPANASQVAAAADFREALQTSVINSGFFRVVEREELDRILKEFKLDLSDLGDPANARKVGKLLGADLIVLGAVTSAGDMQRVSVRLVRISTAEAIRAAARPLGATSGPDAAPTAGTHPVLLVSADAGLESALKEAGLPFVRRTAVPANLKPYAAVWLADKAAIRPTTGEQLRHYVEQGGGLVTSGELPMLLAGSHTLGQEWSQQWLGLRRLNQAEAGYMVKVEFPSKVLGEDLGGATQWTGKRFYVVDRNTAKGQCFGDIAYQNWTFGYTYQAEKGRFYYQGALDDEDHSSVLRRALIGGLKWVTTQQ